MSRFNTSWSVLLANAQQQLRGIRWGDFEREHFMESPLNNDEGCNRYFDMSRSYRIGEIDAFVYDRAALQWGLRNESGLYLAGLSFSQQNYGLILPQDDPARKAVNIAILSTLESEQWHLIVDRYLPADGR